MLEANVFLKQISQEIAILLHQGCNVQHKTVQKPLCSIKLVVFPFDGVLQCSSNPIPSRLA